MPDKLLSDGDSIKGLLGLVGTCVAAFGTLFGVKIRSDIVKTKELEKSKDKNEDDYRSGVEKEQKKQWDIIDGHTKQLLEIEKTVVCLTVRFEDLQRAYFEIAYKNLIKGEK